jgi:putative membrane protein
LVNARSEQSCIFQFLNNQEDLNMKLKRLLMIGLAGLFMTAYAGAQPYGLGPGMMWEDGWGMFRFVHVLWWVLLVVGIVTLIRWTSGRGPRGWRRSEEDRAIEILRERYARGEIDKTEFEERKRDLKT